MGYTYDETKVRGDLFNSRGKWKYTVVLDYSGGDYDTWDLWTEAKNALRRATERGISGVTIREIGEDWNLVVLEPYGKNSYPIMVIGGER